ncbi:MAG: hypothetical protein COA45_01200 [Zetaproteobacteria bacterium]|nr:MAG: hypothetical protein COA45_01200 [Zetaproteobacteria bacterium]
MNKIKSKMFNVAAGLGMLISVSASAQAPTTGDNIIDTAKEAISLLYPAALAVDKAQKSGNITAQKAAGLRLTNAQRQITELFGKGPEGYFTYNYHGRTLKVPVDADLAFIGVRAYTANKDIKRKSGNVIKEGQKYLQFFMKPTLAMTTQFHLALNGIKPDPNRNVEKDMITTSKTSLYPIGQSSTKAAATHIFSIPGRIFSGNTKDTGMLSSFHKISFLDVTNDMFKVCEDRLDELNSDAMDLFAKPSHP